ncbi:HGGxSTG domain-containing protein [Sandarakinorhabdus sp.]|uniref:HGGxSTG domain-containing protein n=1 Tax=Sandarakinorhabdus sp. TaxID=1916663 RepID=UPI0038F652EE
MQSKMPIRLQMHLSPRCGARTRCASECCAPAMPNGRCRMHGGKSPGAPRGNQNAFKHGLYGEEWQALKAEARQLMRIGPD